MGIAKDRNSSTEDTLLQLHEIQVHASELEMHNEELVQARHEVEFSRNMYTELFDFAPVGLLTLDTTGVILNANQAGKQLLEVDLDPLANEHFARFIADPEEKDIFSNHLSLVLQRNVMLKCQVRLTRNDGSVIHTQLQSIAITNKESVRYVLTSIIDGTIRKQFEEKLQCAHNQLELLVLERTIELSKSNMQLTQEIAERKKAERSLGESYAVIKQLKEQFEAENIYLEQEVARQYNFGEIIGQSAHLTQIFFHIEQVAPMNATVLLLGETGTGKGVVARAIHNRSTRKSRPLITVNCATLPATLVESELFGRERGAFTGSDARQIGRFELADGGTIFLDEIGEMPLELQCKLLRVIQDGEFERLGSPNTIKTDVRIIAASNRNLAEEVKNGKFREDLYYRLNVFPITMPPLRQRKDDIPLLVNHFVAKFNLKIGKKISTVSKDTLNSLQEYHWPGNIRELESIIERAVIISQGSSLQVIDRLNAPGKAEESTDGNVKPLAQVEHDHILQVLHKTGWRIEGKKGAAKLLGLNASTLRARIRKYGINRQ